MSDSDTISAEKLSILRGELSDYPRDKCIHQLLEESARLYPDSTAIVFDERKLAYSELNLRANLIARHIISKGITPHTCIGVCAGRTPEFVIAAAGTMKAGCAYVPLDPSYPSGRLEEIIEECGLKFVLANSECFSRLKGFDTENIPIEKTIAGANSTDLSQVENPELEINSENTAYVLFTSGSTGKPKGVEICHRGVINMINWHSSTFGTKAGTPSTQAAKTGFDAAVWEIWSRLCKGAELHFIPDELIFIPEKLIDWLDEHGIEETFLPTPVAEMLIRADWSGKHSLKYLLTGGDRLQNRQPGNFPAHFYNLYGPTECTVASSFGLVKPGRDLSELPHIGRPINNCRIYITGPENEILERGKKGEICIGGDNLGKGYINRPDLTREVFIKNPDPDAPDRIIYKTGDTGCIGEDGNIHFYGRCDFQVQIHGMRIEPGEIENVLMSNKNVRQAVVLAKESDTGAKFLVAYVTAGEKTSPDLAELRDCLHDKLPDYMIPRRIMFLEKFPLTSNGKIDRAALPESDDEDEKPHETAEIKKLNEKELRIAAVWTSILNVKNISPEDDFYALGGDSLKTALIISRLNNEFGCRLPFRLLAENPVFGKFCSEVAENIPGASARFPEIERVPRNRKHYPMSFSQEALWFLWQLNEERVGYNIPLQIEIKGRLDTRNLEKALRSVIGRHESFRLRFFESEGSAVEALNENFETDIPFHDLSVLPEDEKSGRLDSIREKSGRTPFDLNAGNLARADIIKLADEDFILFFTLHHIITDGWSMGMFFSELRHAYLDLAQGKELSPPEPGLDFIDSCIWQRKYLNRKTLPRQLDFWMKKLNPLPGKMQLSSKEKSGIRIRCCGRRLAWNFSPGVTRSLRRLAQDTGSSLFVIMTALLKIMIHKYISTDDIVVATPYANRSSDELENVFGYLSNVLVLRTEISGEISFYEAVSRVRNTCAEAFSNADLHFEEILEELEKRNFSHRDPLFNVMIVFQNYPMPEMDFAGIKLKPRTVSNGSAITDLMLNCEESDDGLECWLEYDTELFSEDAVRRMAEHLGLLAEKAVENPGQPINTVSLLSDGEAELLRKWNESDTPFPDDKSYIELFLERVRKNPGNTAFSFMGKTLSYSALNEASNKLAHHLIGLGAGAEIPVAVCLGRSQELPVSLLGIMKSGSPYLPLDPSYPPDRLHYMLENSKAALLVSDSETLEKTGLERSASSIENLKIIRLDGAKEDISQQSSENPGIGTGPGNTAYIIYTSGSTGNPKGVQVSHRNLINHNMSVIRQYALSENDRVMQFGSISFDLSVEEIFPSWLAGATLVMRTEEAVSSIPAFLNFVEEEEISVLDLPTAFWHSMADEMQMQSLSASVRLVVIGGEKAFEEKFRVWIEKTGGKIRLLNTYGPTETTVISTIYETPPEYAEGFEFLLGKPIANTKLYVLDRSLRLVPPGIAGELYIGGAGVAKAYINNPALTSERFIENPFTKKGENDRIYKTGDIVSWRNDGNLEYRGRSDFQIKLRGHRIEPGDIDSVIMKYPGINGSAIRDFTDDRGNRYLAAYLVCDAKTPVREKDLRAFLKERLPDYMLPSSFTFLDRLPETSSGKIDRLALPEPDLSSRSSEYVPPQTPIQRLLCEVTGEILDVTAGLNDNFFLLGGDSLLSMRVIDRVRKAGLGLTPEQIMASDTIGELAETVQNNFGKVKTGELKTLIKLKNGDGSENPLFLIHPPSGFLLCYATLTQNLSPSATIYGFQAPGLHRSERIIRSIPELADFYIAELLRFKPEGPYCLGGWCFGGSVAYEMARKLSASGHKVGPVILIDTPAPKPEKQIWTYYLDKLTTLLFKTPFRKQLRYFLVKFRALFKGPSEEMQRIENFMDNEGPNIANRGVVWQANVNSFHAYKGKPYDGTVYLLMAEKPFPDMINSPTMGWAPLKKDIKLVKIPGDHDTILSQPNVKIVAEKMEEIIGLDES